MMHSRISLLFCLTLFGSSLGYYSLWTPDFPENLEWWQTSVIYQIYPKSFKDTDGDGVGDIKGIINSLQYFKYLGIEALWISSIYKSPMKDNGCDISNFTAIDPLLGTMEDFKKLVDEMKKMDMKLIMDFEPNHSSDQHEWFQKSVKNDTDYKDFYVWANPIYDNLSNRQPPNNWLSVYGGSAWTYKEERRQYYLHQFSEFQPDFNLRNQKVVDELWKAMNFWLGLGVSGFRMGSVNLMFEKEGWPNEPINNHSETTNSSNYEYLSHKYTKDLPEVFDLLATFRRRLDNYSMSTDKVTRVMITEAYTEILEVLKYYGNDTRRISHFPFNFDLISMLDRNADSIFMAITGWTTLLPEKSWPNWVIGNHETSRVATRYNQYLVDGFNMLTLLLPGTAVTYYGEEIGMEDTFIPYMETKDIKGLLAGPVRYREVSRDPQRTPFQWSATKFAGFSRASSTWLPVNSNYQRINIWDQKLQNDSHLNIFQDLVKLRKLPAIQKGALEMATIGSRIFAFKRYYKENELAVVFALNFGDDELENINLGMALNLNAVALEVNITSAGTTHVEGDLVMSDDLSLLPNEGVVFTYIHTSSASLFSLSFTLLASLMFALHFLT